jgi:2'-5' RNA ligase
LSRTALIVAVPEAEPAVGEHRLKHDWSAARGVPAHITILFPFVESDDVDEDALADLFASLPSFEFTLDRVERFDGGIVWLHPEPSELFAQLTAAVWRRWPDYPPYEGAHATVIPHLTVSETPLAFELAEPIASRATEVTLIEEQPDGRWTTRRRFPLASAA